MTDFIDLSHPKILIYGEPGVGKTTWIAQAAEHMKMLLINVDGGLMSLHGMKTKPLIKPVGDRLAPKSDLIKATEDIVFKAVAGKGEYEGLRAIGLDSVSELQNRDLEDLSAGADDVERDHYRKSTNRLRRVLRMLRDAPFTVLLTALPKQANDNKGNLKSIYPALSRAAAESVHGFMDAVWYAYRNQSGEFILLTKKRGPIYAKGRGPLDKLPDEYKGSFGDVYKKLQEAGEEK